MLYVVHHYHPSGTVGLVPVFLKINYWSEYLIVRILDFSAPIAEPNADVQLKRHATYVVPPLLQSTHVPAPTEKEVLAGIPDFNASHFATYVQIASTNPDLPPHSVALQEFNTEDRPVSFEYGERDVPEAFRMSQPYMQKITAAIRDTLMEAGEPCPLP